MKFIISGKNIEITNALRERVEKKLSKLEKYIKKDVDVHVTLSVEKIRHIIEVTIPFYGMILRAEEESTDMYSAIDLVIESLERQIRKYKTKISKRTKEAESLRYITSIDFEEEEQTEDFIIAKTKKFPIKPMSVEEAILEMNLVGHNFFVFLNGDTEKVNVVYKRNDGAYGLIEPEY
ncbi:ribosome hibernation-promoting factor, HPF/YfiA family [Caldicellulosiruptoraceae bacterium PP1]